MSVHRYLIVLLTLATFTPPTFVQALEKRNKVEEFLIWKLSDELKLTAKEEKEFTEIIKKLNAQKAEQNRILQDSIEKMKKASEKNRSEELARYRKALTAYNHVSEEEFDELKPLLGNERLAQYLYIKQDLAARIKSMLITPEANGKAKPTLPQPKLIEEK